MLSTVAIFELLLFQVIFLFVALLGLNVIFSVSEFFSFNLNVVLFIVISFNSIVSTTFTVHVDVYPDDETVMIVVPIFLAVIFPFESTVATLLLLLRQVTSLLDALLGETLLVSFSDEFIVKFKFDLF